jgi:16S rRNA processing protein RimM
MQASEWLEIGKIVAAQGLKGELRVYPNSDFPERFETPGKRWLLPPGGSEPQVVELVSGRYLQGKGLYVIRLAGISDRNQAEALRDYRLMVPESDRPVLEADEFHVLDLIDLPVFDQATQTRIGVVKDVIPAGNDLLEVQLDQPTGELSETSVGSQTSSKSKTTTVLIPFVKEIVPVVDLEQRRIEITPPPGLLDT